MTLWKSLLFFCFFFAAFSSVAVAQSMNQSTKLSFEKKWSNFSLNQKWFNTGSQEEIRFKNKYFTHLQGKQKPRVLFSRYSFEVVKSAKASDVVSFRYQKSFGAFLNGRDISRRKTESTSSWFRRVFPVKVKKSYSLRDLIFDKAFAAGSDSLSALDAQKGESDWTALIASMLFDDFIHKEWNLQEDQTAREMMDTAAFLVNAHGLQCNRNVAHFRFKFSSHSDKTFNIRTEQVPNSNRVSFDIMEQPSLHNLRGDFLRVSHRVYSGENNWGLEHNISIDSLRGRGRTQAMNFQTSHGLGALSSQLQWLEGVSEPVARPWEIKPEMDSLMHRSDIARACCSNLQCREYTQVQVGDRPRPEPESAP